MSASTDDLNPEVDVDKSEPVVVDEVASEDPLATLTNDLQRLQAEYANYRKRVERDRELVKDLAVASVLSELLGTLDDLDRARAHDELSGGFKAVADQLLAVTTKLGLVKFGSENEAFDPQVHEALMHENSPDVKETSVTKVLQPGYKFKERVIRPARVAVADPE